MKIKKLIIIVSLLFVSPSALAIGEANNKDTLGASNIDEVTDPKEQVLKDSVYRNFATTVQLDSLKSEMEELKIITLEKSEDGFGIGNMLIALLLGMIGGLGAFVVLEKRRNSKSQPTKDYPSNADTHSASSVQYSNPAIQAESRHPSMSMSSKSKPKTDGNSSSRPETQRNISAVTHKDVSKKRNEEVTAEPAPVVRKADIHRIAFGNLSIPARDMLIITVDDLTDSETGKDFEFDLNETKGTGSYTFAPEVATSALSRLSSLEPFVEPFNFNSSVRNVKVSRPGSVILRDGYWQVDSKIIISLS